jgi:hypothetical protein
MWYPVLSPESGRLVDPLERSGGIPEELTATNSSAFDSSKAEHEKIVIFLTKIEK